MVGEVKKVGKSRNFHLKVGKSRNFSVFKVGKCRNFISIFITSLHTCTSKMLVLFVDFEVNHLFVQKMYILHPISCYCKTCKAEIQQV